MKLTSDSELDNTRAKLRILQQSYSDLQNELAEDEELRQASMESLMRLINQFKEEIARYEASRPRPQPQKI